MSVVKIIELIGTSKNNWEEAANNAVKEASKTVDDITGIEIISQTARVDHGKIVEYRANVKAAFKVGDR